MMAKIKTAKPPMRKRENIATDVKTAPLGFKPFEKGKGGKALSRLAKRKGLVNGSNDGIIPR